MRGQDVVITGVSVIVQVPQVCDGLSKAGGVGVAASQLKLCLLHLALRSHTPHPHHRAVLRGSFNRVVVRTAERSMNLETERAEEGQLTWPWLMYTWTLPSSLLTPVVMGAPTSRSDKPSPFRSTTHRLEPK